MKLRRSLLWAGSAAITVLLIVLLIKISKLDLRVTVQQLRSVSWLSFAKLVYIDRCSCISLHPKVALCRCHPSPFD